VTGCNRLRFEAAMAAHPDTSVADSPAGLDVEVKVPQSLEFAGLATPPLREAVVQLPAGVALNPASAQGLQGCSSAQIGLGGGGAPECPAASEIGTLELTTPLLEGTLHGSVFIASQDDNPAHATFALYLVVNDPETGLVVKIPGWLSLDPQSGRITTHFENTPQFPFSDLKVHLKGGPRGVLATAESCGLYTATAALTPWSAPESGPDANPFDTFAFTSGCVSGFAPSFTAGSTIPQAGAFSPLVLSFSRSDTDQELSQVSVSLPPGLLGRIAGLQRCSDEQLAGAEALSGAAQAASPSCPAGSRIGTVTVGAGPGSTPLSVSGQAYLTGPYKGAPFGIAVVIPALAGPFDLGNVVVRSALSIDPSDGHVTVSSDPFPVMVRNSGVPVRLRQVNISIDRPGFTFNPTSCEPMTIAGTLASTGGLNVTDDARFQVGGCQSLPFKPALSASTQGHTSKLNGASLTVNVTQKPGEANIHKVDLQLPVQLPSRLSTLQKACTDAQFNTNPAGCPAQARVGSASVSTPLLNNPLAGPAYLVSHGSAAFPDLEMVLQGEGVTIILDGKTTIKAGITYSKFETAPDAPISSFTAVFPQGPHSILAANVNLCHLVHTSTIKQRVLIHAHGKSTYMLRRVKHTTSTPLKMPTVITGQNGATITQSTPIHVNSCTTPIVKHPQHNTTPRKHPKH
jgi:hypothetical protein